MIDDLPPDDLPRNFPQGSEDAEQARWLFDALDRKVRYDHTSDRWHVWNGHLWAPDKTREVQRRVTELAYNSLIGVATSDRLGQRQRTALEKVYRRLLDVGRTESALKSLSQLPEYKTDGSDWDQDPYLLGCANGIVDLRTNTLIENPGPETLVTRSTGHRFVPFEPEYDKFEAIQRHIPRMWKFLMEVTSEDADLAMFYLLWFGYSLFGTTAEQKFLILTGLGRNGKGALVSTMRYVFGDYSAEADASLYMRSRFGAARSDGARADLMALKGKRLAVMSEPDGGAFNEEMLKAHTGGDPIVARGLFSNNVISWVPTHTITFLTNEPPKVNDIGPSMADRVLVADFRERFEGERQDKKLYDKLRTEAEGILGVLCYAARAWFHSETGLPIPDRIRDASREYLESNDPLGRAINEAFSLDSAGQGGAAALFEAYQDWFERVDAAGEPMTQTAFGLALARKGFKKLKTKTGWVYRGIRPLNALEAAGVVL